MVVSKLCPSVSGGAAITLAALTFVYFLENFDRYLIAVSPVPYVDYTSYEYSVLAGPAFTVVYTVGGLVFALYFMDESAKGLLLSNNKTGIWKHTKLIVLSACSVIFSFAFFATALCTQFFELVFIRIAMGLTQSVVTPFSTSLIRDIFPPTSTGAAFGVFNAGTYFAFAFSLSVGTYMYNEFGWRAGYIWFGIIGMGVGAILPFLAYLPVPPVTPGLKEQYSALSVDDSVHNVLQHGDDTTPSQTPPLAPTPAEPTSQRMKDTLYAVLGHWKACPALWLVCLATGVRLGGGYIWSAYTPLFFSPLLTPEDNSISCSYSYNATATALGDMCGKDYPYCKGGECNSLNSYPWHNEGLSPNALYIYMSWIPILGGALGNALGGVLSDHWVRAADRSHLITGLSVRPLVCCFSNLIALPLIAVSFFLPSPACFLIYIASGAVGEVYLSQSLALITDAQIAPGYLTPPSVALFMMIVTLIGGNAPLLIPTLLPLVGFNEDVTVTFSAKGSDPDVTGDVQYTIDNTDSKQLQYSLLYALSACYGGAAALYLLAFLFMQKGKSKAVAELSSAT